MKIQKQLAEKLFAFFHKDLSENNYRAFNAKDVIFYLKDKNSFETSWDMGGTSGNCYDSTLRRVSAQPESELTQLDDFLMEYFPSIGFLQYKLITRNVEKSVKGHGDYYGGETETGHKELSFSDLDSALVKGKVLDSEEMVDFSSFVEQKACELYPEKAVKAEKAEKESIKALGIADQKKIKRVTQTIKSEKPVPSRKKKM